MTGRVVKDRPTRLVEECVLQGGVRAFRKTARIKNHPWRRFLATLHLSSLDVEARRLASAQALGVRVPRVLGIDRSHWWFPREVRLSTETLEGFSHVDTTTIQWEVFAEQLGAALRSWHRLGVVHRDLHPGNVLQDRFGSLALIDGRNLLIRGRLSKGDRRESLLTVLRGFRPLREPACLDAFRRGYGDDEAPDIWDGLPIAAESDLTRHLKDRAKRALRSNLDFHVVQRRGKRWQLRVGFEPPDDVQDLLEAPQRTFKQGRSATVILAAMASGAEPVVLKVFHPQSKPLRELWNRIRGSRAQRAFVRGHLLELLQVPTPRVLGYCDESRWPRKSVSYLLTECSKGTQITEVWDDLDPADRRLLLTSLAQGVGRIHRANCSHHDLKGRNVLWSRAEGISFLDLDSLTVLSSALTPDRRLSDLSRLAAGIREVRQFSTRDALGFLRAYGDAAGIDDHRSLFWALNQKA
ncbi:MAG TPA: lipopolysaccharide kinase InaA family protein [Planctomycetota bacterium]|nr:lipopolysaccharide kinase InaA family protein [Planctomycetota bacterium]